MAAVPRARKDAAKKPSTAAYNAGLAKLIDADPDDTGAWSVYADWLQSQGDPRGELGVVQERLRAQPKNKALLAAEKKLLKDHAGALVGELARFMTREGKPDIPGATAKPLLEPEYRTIEDGGFAPLQVRWRAGFFSEIFIGHPGYDWTPVGSHGEERGEFVGISGLLLDVLAHPAARFLTSLRLGMPTHPDDGSAHYGALWKKLSNHEALGRLRSLYVGDITHSESEVSWIVIDDIAKLFPAMTKLRSLTLRGGSGMKLGKLALPELRELTIITGALDKKNLAAIAAAKWPKLERLELWFGSSTYGANTTLEDVVPILAGTQFPKLVHLALRNCEFADELAPAVATSQLVKQLATLDLSKGTLTEVGVEALAAHKPALAHLARIDLSDNFLGASTRLAATLAKAVRTKPQRTPSTYDNQQRRYVALGE